jgi:hypothetical protein
MNSRKMAAPGALVLVVPFACDTRFAIARSAI